MSIYVHILLCIYSIHETPMSCITQSWLVWQGSKKEATPKSAILSLIYALQNRKKTPITCGKGFYDENKIAFFDFQKINIPN